MSADTKVAPTLQSVCYCDCVFCHRMILIPPPACWNCHVALQSVCYCDCVFCHRMILIPPPACWNRHVAAAWQYLQPPQAQGGCGRSASQAEPVKPFVEVAAPIAGNPRLNSHKAYIYITAGCPGLVALGSQFCSSSSRTHYELRSVALSRTLPPGARQPLVFLTHAHSSLPPPCRP